ncbi:MAG: NCS2 family permease [Saprospiraceae bacterium]|jgi:AGZA family xanthine/uracil permease-like MFS transporter|nr:NCS2 family permease [Saprospiraceae bacterium]
MSDILNKYFEFDLHKTNLKTEILAGVSTFLSLSYIFVVNPAILSEGGINKSAVLFATVIASAAATIAMGLWAKKPFALAPGLEINGYVVYFLIIGLGFTWQQSLGAVFWSGIIFLVLTLTGIREKIITAIPTSLKIALAASVGIFLIIIALRLSNILIYDKTKLINIGSIFTYQTLILLVGYILAWFLKKKGSKYFILTSIILCTFLAHIFGLQPGTNKGVSLNSEMFIAVGKLDLSVIFNAKMIAPIIILFVLDFYGSIAKFIGLSQNTSILDENGDFPKMKEALVVDGVATTIGASLGTTSIVAFVESGVGIGAGGRTGLTAVVCGILMLLFIPLSPIVNLVPVIATTGALLWVGIKLMPQKVDFAKMQIIEKISVLIMIVVTIATFSLDKAMLAGFLFLIFGFLFKGRIKEISPYLIISTLIIFISVVLSLVYE